MQQSSLPSKPAEGFSLVEMLVALAVFLIVSAGAMELIQQHLPLVTSQQNQSGMNLNLQNAVGQLQTDVSNAGSNYYTYWNQIDTPVGLTILNCANLTTANAATVGCPAPGSGSGCFSAGPPPTYGANCFDTINVFIIDPASWGLIQPASTSSPCTDISASSSITIAPQQNQYSSLTAAQQATQLAADYHTGDQILLVHISTGSYNMFTTTQLTSGGAVSGNNVQLQFHETESGGGTASQTYDPYYITSVEDTTRLTSQFGCSPTDWVLRISQVVTYYVNTSNSADPQLVRVVNAGNPVAANVGTPTVVADQVIGFKIGAMAWNTNSGDTNDESSYLFNASAATPSGASPLGGCTSNCGFDNIWPLVRSVMVSIIARTPPNSTNKFRNTFDGGAYQLQSISVIINPRNQSMRDNCYNGECPSFIP